MSSLRRGVEGPIPAIRFERGSSMKHIAAVALSVAFAPGTFMVPAQAAHRFANCTPMPFL